MFVWGHAHKYCSVRYYYYIIIFFILYSISLVIRCCYCFSMIPYIIMNERSRLFLYMNTHMYRIYDLSSHSIAFNVQYSRILAAHINWLRWFRLNVCMVFCVCVFFASFCFVFCRNLWFIHIVFIIRISLALDLLWC